MHIRKQSEHFLEKIIDLSIEYVHLLLVGSLLTKEYVEEHIQKAKPYFSKKCERAGVCAASCERTFGGIGKAKAASEGTTKKCERAGVWAA